MLIDGGSIYVYDAKDYTFWVSLDALQQTAGGFESIYAYNGKIYATENPFTTSDNGVQVFDFIKDIR